MTVIQVVGPVPRFSRGRRESKSVDRRFGCSDTRSRSTGRRRLCTVNLSTNTIWEGDIGAIGEQFAYYKDKVGRQFISEAAKIRDKSHDFLILTGPDGARRAHICGSKIFELEIA